MRISLGSSGDRNYRQIMTNVYRASFRYYPMSGASCPHELLLLASLQLKSMAGPCFPSVCTGISAGRPSSSPSQQVPA